MPAGGIQVCKNFGMCGVHTTLDEKNYYSMKLNRYFPFRINLIVLFLSCLMPVKAALTDGLILHYDFESIRYFGL